MTRDQVFISYCHVDREWLERLQTMLAPLQRQGTLDVWADTRIQPGQRWKEEIQKALARAKVAVLLVSPDFLASEFIHKNELLPLLEAAKNEGLTILWVPVRPSLYSETAIAHYQATYDPRTPLSTLPPAQQETALVVIAQRLTAIRPISSPPLARPSAPAPSSVVIPVPEQGSQTPSPSPTAPTSSPVSPPQPAGTALPRHNWKLLLVGVVLAILSGTGVYYVGHKWSSLPLVDNMPAPQVKDLQKQTALVLKQNIEFRDPLKDGSQGPWMVVIPGGRFQMGSPDTEPRRSENEHQHEVEVQAFAMGKYEVTVGQFKRFVEVTQYKTDAERGGGCYYQTANGEWKQDADKSWQNPGFSQTDNHPVVCISWNDTAEYVNWLRGQTGKQYRLPTEAEWEYAVRAGTTTPFYFGDTISTDQANYNGNYTYADGHKGFYQQRTLEVGQFPANAWGLHDMHGNVGEWTCSVYDKEYGGGEQRCAEPGTSSPRVLRGGSWSREPGRLRGAARNWYSPHNGLQGSGFRLARTFSL